MSYHSDRQLEQNLWYLGQDRRNALSPLNLGVFGDTSLRLLQGEFKNQYRPDGARAYNEDQVRNSTPYGVGGGTRSNYFKVTLSRPGWLILTKGGQFPNYLEVSCYTFDNQPVEQRFIHDADSVTIQGEEGRYFPFLDTVAGSPSNLYNDFNPFTFDNGNTTYAPLAAGDYLICISTIRTEPFKYEVGLVIEYPPDEVFIICEDAPDDDGDITFVVQQDAISTDGDTIDDTTEIIRGSDGSDNGLISTNENLTTPGINYWSFSGIGIASGSQVTIGTNNTWMIAPNDDPVGQGRIECNFEESYLNTIHDRDLNVWKDAWERDFANTQAFPLIFEYLVNLPELPNLEELASREEYAAYRARTRLSTRSQELAGSDIYGY